MKNSILIVVFMMLLLFISDIGSANESKGKEEKLIGGIQSRIYKGVCQDAKCRSTCVSEGYNDGACFSLQNRKKNCVCYETRLTGGKKIANILVI
ncbi:hypothetical protein ABFX02_11G099700 [Erythranthe guttata]